MYIFERFQAMVGYESGDGLQVFLQIAGQLQPEKVRGHHLHMLPWQQRKNYQIQYTLYELDETIIY